VEAFPAIEPLPPIEAGSAVAMSLIEVPQPQPTAHLALSDPTVQSTDVDIIARDEEEAVIALAAIDRSSPLISGPVSVARHNILRTDEVLVQILDTFVIPCFLWLVSSFTSLA